MEKSLRQISLIARGVEARQEFLTGHSKLVTQETANIARQLRIPEEQIERWLAEREMLGSQINAAIKSSQKVISVKR